MLVSVRDLADKPQMLRGEKLADPVEVDSTKGITQKLMASFFPSSLMPKTREEKREIQRASAHDRVQRQLDMANELEKHMTQAFDNARVEALDCYNRLWHDCPPGQTPNFYGDRYFRTSILALARIDQQREEFKYQQLEMRDYLRQLKTDIGMQQFNSQLLDMTEALLQIREESLGKVDLDTHENRLSELRERKKALDDMDYSRNQAASEIFSSFQDKPRQKRPSARESAAASDRNAEEAALFNRMFEKFLPVLDPKGAAHAASVPEPVVAAVQQRQPSPEEARVRVREMSSSFGSSSRYDEEEDESWINEVPVQQQQPATTTTTTSYQKRLPPLPPPASHLRAAGNT